MFLYQFIKCHVAIRAPFSTVHQLHSTTITRQLPSAELEQNIMSSWFQFIHISANAADQVIKEDAEQKKIVEMGSCNDKKKSSIERFLPRKATVSMKMFSQQEEDNRFLLWMLN